MTPTHEENRQRVNLKVYKETSQDVNQLRKELGFQSPADVFHVLIDSYPEPEPQPQPERKLVTKQIYEADHQKLIRLKNALKCVSYADLLVELVRYYEQPYASPPPPATPAPPPGKGEELFTNILAYLERKRKANRKPRIKKE